MEKSWSLSCHNDRNLEEINECTFQPSGRLWPDLQNLVQILGASMHPAFKYLKKPETRFIANSIQFDDFSFGILCKAISDSQLKHLVFTNTNLTQSALSHLTNLLSCTPLQSLQLDWNPLPTPQLFNEFASSTLKIQHLSLKSCGIDDLTFALICSSLKENIHLKSLDLFGNSIKDLKGLGEMLIVNRSLINLNLSGNSICDEDLGPLVGTFGKILYSEKEAVEFRSIEREKAKMKIQHFGKNNFTDFMFTDEIIVDEETQEYFLLKNQAFMHFNLSLNKFTTDHFLRLILSVSLKNFKILLSGNPLPESLKVSLTQAFPLNLIIN